jgi:hypothetical protein
MIAVALRVCIGMSVVSSGCSEEGDALVELDQTVAELSTGLALDEEQTQADSEGGGQGAAVSQGGEPWAAVRYEAEDHTGQSGCSMASNRPGFTGTGFMRLGGKDSWIEWSNVIVNVGAASPYRLVIRYANGSASARSASVELNGSLVGSLELNPTGAWNQWRTVSLAVSLRRGRNTIRLKANTGAGFPNIDHFVTIPDPTTVALPLEVLGPTGTRVSVNVRVDNPARITHLYIRCNSCGYQDEALDGDATKVKASVRVNGGNPIALKHYRVGAQVVGNPDIEVIGAESEYGGIGGAFRTVRIKVPVTGVVAGVNTFTFEHVQPSGPSIGFRVLELNLLRSGSLLDRVIPDRIFVRDDPSRWRAPLQSASEISAGKALWQKRNSLYDPGVDALDGQMNRAGPLTGNITASCADCHASDGRDLKYFNFSNFSIIERSYFHGLSRNDGARIASYIRSLALPVVSAARPWNPTYQPGPGLDARPAYEWAAGAGLDAILDSDAEMEPYLFPNGISLGAVRSVVDRYATLNLRELAVSLPMPEWNQWLPLIHPDDVFDTQAVAVRTDRSGVNVGAPYYTALYEAARANPTPANLGAMTQQIKSWLRRDLTCISNGPGNGEPWRGLNGAVLSSLSLPTPKKFTASNCNDERARAEVEPFEIAKRGLSAWLSVKQWELVHGNDLETAGSQMTAPICSSGRCIDASEPRGWVVEGRNVFDRAPHFTSHKSIHFYGQNRVAGVLESNAWYHLNMILNPGYRRTMPSHFAYTYTLVEVLQRESNTDQGYRFWATVIKQRQLQTNGRYGVEEGLDLRTAQPYVYYASQRGDTGAQGSIGQPLWGYVAQALVEDFVADANNATAQDWANATGNSVVQARDSTDFGLCNDCFEPASTTAPFELVGWQGRNTYRVIPKLREIGVAQSALASLITWGKKTWPKGDWAALRPQPSNAVQSF